MSNSGSPQDSRSHAPQLPGDCSGQSLFVGAIAFARLRAFTHPQRPGPMTHASLGLSGASAPLPESTSRLEDRFWRCAHLWREEQQSRRRSSQSLLREFRLCVSCLEFRQRQLRVALHLPGYAIIESVDDSPPHGESRASSERAHQFVFVDEWIERGVELSQCFAIIFVIGREFSRQFLSPAGAVRWQCWWKRRETW